MKKDINSNRFFTSSFDELLIAYSENIAVPSRQHLGETHGLT